ncbi:glycoside hydrolase family 13 protein [Ligilactobacillus ceti]|uniref:Intracellular maltogenic amylase n=1 Tax=Ligilactobacillus ceti DSM 22408 TaxID=1122146 RepID=A0A0R2KJF4_9LACO|nr:glycoside hydrolase family 13 protein [Ligilactobacillus ceti]KRN89323.1 Intracellular maltogenic amylase [Ligilactobacillus ceti DSM 22408]
MEAAALYHRPDSEMAYLVDKTTIHIRLQAKKADLQAVWLVYGDPYDLNYEIETQTNLWEFQKIPLKVKYQTQYHDIWSCEVQMPLKRMQYSFLVQDQCGQLYFYDERGIYLYQNDRQIQTSYGFKMPYFHDIDRLHAPQWAQKTIWYQIFPERFANGDERLNPPNCLPWGSAQPTPFNFFGGDFQGIIDHLHYLKELGVNGLYLCPIFAATSNHKYDTIDYFKLDPAFGDEKTFREFIQQAHQLGFKVMLDAVFNHIGDQSPYWQDVVQNGAKSVYIDWFYIADLPVNYTATDNYEIAKNLNYEVFAKNPHMPKLKTSNPQVQAYLLEIATFWVEKFGIDAWRLDVANEIDHHFWRKFTQKMQQLNPDIYILGEVWHDASPWVNHGEFSGAMNYPYTDAILAGLVRRDITLETMINQLNYQLSLHPDQVNRVLFNALDTHDTARLLTLCQGDKALMLQALAFLLIQIGAPCLYYGTEIGLTGGPDPDCRKCMIWDEKEQDLTILTVIKELISLRKKYLPQFNQGNVRWEVATDNSAVFWQINQNHESEIISYFNISPNNFQLPPEDKKLLLANLYQADQKLLLPGGWAIFTN